MRFGLPLVSPRSEQWYRRWPEKISYLTSLVEIELRANAGCVWCQFVLRRAAGYRHSDERLNITVCGHVEMRDDGLGEMDPKYQWISMKINGQARSPSVYVYAAFGASVYLMAFLSSQQ